MTATFETHVAGDPAALRSAALHLTHDLARGAGVAADHLAAERAALAASWRGAAADAFATTVSDAASAADDVRVGADVLGLRLAELADVLEAVQDGMAGLRERARAEGLLVHGTLVARPPVATAVGAAPSPRELGLDCVVAGLAGHAEELHERWQRALEAYTELVHTERESLAESMTELVTAGWHTGLLAAASPRLGTRLATLLDARDALADRWQALRQAAARRRVPPPRPSPLDRVLPGFRHLDRGLGVLGTALDVRDIKADMDDGEPWWQATLSQGAGIVLTAGFTSGGAVLGGAAGSLASPGAGTVVGAAAGGAGGAAAGDALGDEADDRIDRWAESDERERLAAERERDEARIRALLAAGDGAWAGR